MWSVVDAAHAIGQQTGFQLGSSQAGFLVKREYWDITMNFLTDGAVELSQVAVRKEGCWGVVCS